MKDISIKKINIFEDPNNYINNYYYTTISYICYNYVLTFLVSMTDSDTFKVSGELHLIGMATPSSV